uniref:MADF domain-containing protein n=1 Tax=Anopheles epiroticus TaxID=199890 RepID=A0A182P6A7_9DIPT
MAKYSDNTVIEFVTVDPNNDFDKDSIEDSETEEPKLLPRLNKIRKIVRYQTVKRTGSRQSVHVKRFNRNKIDVSTMPVLRKKIQKLIPMSEEKTLNLIYRIEQEACLWDRTRDDYRNKTLKDAAWNRIVRSTGIPIEIIKAKWSSLLGSYRHYRAKHMKGYGTEMSIFIKGEPFN